MTSVDLGEIRALLRAEHAVVSERPRGSLLAALKSWLQAPPPTPMPVAAAPVLRARDPILLPSPARTAAPDAGVGETLELFSVSTLPAPRRACFGLAEGVERPPAAAEPAGEPEPELDFDPQAAVVVAPRRSSDRTDGEPADPRVGAAEILELQELLAERMPSLLTRIDLAAKTDPAVAEIFEEPPIHAVIAEVEAARAAADLAYAEASGEAPEHPESPADAAPERPRLRFVAPPAPATEDEVISHLHAHLEAEHHAVACSLAALHSEFVTLRAAA